MYECIWVWSEYVNLMLKNVFFPILQLVVTSSSKERIQVTFCPVGDLDHPIIEVDCEPGHPFMVEKKGARYTTLSEFYFRLNTRHQKGAFINMANHINIRDL